MGNWTMIIEGSGAHHNVKELTTGYRKGDNGDADLSMQQFVAEMQARGQIIKHATFMYGGQREDYVHEGSYADLRGAKIDKAGMPSCLSFEQLKDLEENGRQWNNENFRKLMNTVDVLLTEREAMRNRLKGVIHDDTI